MRPRSPETNRTSLEGSNPRLGEVLDFMRLIWALDHSLQKASKRMNATIGVTGPQRLVIRILARFPGIAAGQVARLLHVHPSTLTGVLKRLEREGLIRRRPDPSDGRRASLGITDRGRRVDAVRAGTVEAAVRRVLSNTPRAKVATARQLLITLAEALGPHD
jgi:MarR family transcriptional regulator, organic hydroperoxide resistance regulator